MAGNALPIHGAINTFLLLVPWGDPYLHVLPLNNEKGSVARI